MIEWWNNMDLVGQIFALIAIPSTLVLVVQTVLLLFGIGGDDIDADGIMELPSLVPMRSIDMARPDSGQNLIRWYSVTSKGDQVDKLPGKCIDLLALFALLAGTATTFALSLIIASHSV